MTTAPIAAPTADELLDIPVADIRPSPDNPRGDVGDVSDLAESIAEQGVIEPLIVRPHAEGGFVLIAGERRLTASRQAGLAAVPCIVRDVDDATALEQTIVENLHRSDLKPVEEAAGYSHLRRLGLTQEEIARKCSRSQSHVSKRIALLLLPEAALAELDKGRLSVSQAEQLAYLRDDDARMARLLPRIGASTFDQLLVAEIGEAKREKARQAKIDDLEAAGVTIVLTYSWKDTLAPTGVEVDPIAHADEPCHAACVNHSGEVVLLCTDRDRHTPDGDSDLKAPNLAASDPQPGDADAPRSTSPGAPRPAGATSPRSGADGAAGAPAGEAVQTAIEVPKSPLELEREADKLRREAFAATRPARRQRQIDFLAKAKPSKRDLVKFLAAQLCDDQWVQGSANELCALLSLEADGEKVDWHGLDEQEAIDALSAFVAKGDAQADRFLLAFTFLLVEDGLSVYGNRWNGGAVGDLADDPQIARHYDYLADIGYKPTDAEKVLLTPLPADEAPSDPADDSAGMTATHVEPELDEILVALANVKVAFFAGADEHDIDEQRFVDAGEADAIETSGLGHRLHRIEVTEVDDDGPTGAELVPWETLGDFDPEDAQQQGEGADDPDVEGDDALESVDGADSHDVGHTGSEPDPATCGEPAADVAPSSADAAGDPPDDATAHIGSTWAYFTAAIEKARDLDGAALRQHKINTDVQRAIFADAVAAPHPDPAAAATALSVLFDEYVTEIDEVGPINTTKRGPDDLHRFDRFPVGLVEIVEAAAPILPDELRREVLEVDGISWNRREGCPKGHLFPRLRVEDLIDAYTRRVQS